MLALLLTGVSRQADDAEVSSGYILDTLFAEFHLNQN
jgi:hypothetical protein